MDEIGTGGGLHEDPWGSVRYRQNQHGEQPVTQLGDGDGGMLPNEEGNERRASVSLIAGTCRSGHTVCVLQGPEISKFS